MTATPFPFDATERLAKRVLGGTVVFFIGAGFSLDSENNTAKRFIGRLLARLLAMGTCLAPERLKDGSPSQGRAVLDALGSVFSLTEAKRKPGEEYQPARCMTPENVALLAREYYTFNEWSISALGVLSREMSELGEERRRVVAVCSRQLENFLVGLAGDEVPLEAVDWTALSHFESDAVRGKALFLDTMGFANAEIMAGALHESDVDLVAESYRGRLRPRHHALARLAREGLLPTVVTTNYDLLLEGAYRLAGFQERKDSVPASSDPCPPTTVPGYSAIAGADQFFARGENYRAALLLKIHGCVGRYREARAASLHPNDADPQNWASYLPLQPWASYLPALVFTYREIQTWRADAWSRDLLRTLLRTNTLALCGYSGSDPVMHATFREVYEEMAQARDRNRFDRKSEDAPLFFFDVAGKREFHGLEILRAATEAIGSPSLVKLVEHPNRVEFQTEADGFPTVDDHLRWLLHSVLREEQGQALSGHLRRLALQVLRHPCSDADHQRLYDRFQMLRKEERDRIAAAASPLEVRRAFESAVAWTWHFLPGFLRELALAELVDSQQGPGSFVRSLRRGWWYFPASERLEWTAWAAVVELALREMVATWRGAPAAEAGAAWEWIAAEDSPYATISFARDEGQRQPLALCIRLAGFARPGRSAGPLGAYRRVTAWELGEQDVPWRTAKRHRCPDAATLWQYALGQMGPRKRTAYYLGALDVHH